MAGRRLLPTLYAVSFAVAVIILGPLLRPGYLLYRDAVSTPRTYVTDATLGIDGLPPRAVPQDWFVAVLSTVVDGGWVVTATLFAALVAAGVGFGRMAARLVPGAGRAGAAGAAIVSVWNPFVAERLLQGHWGLLVGYAALGWIVVALMDLRDHRSTARWAQLAGLVAIAGLTPTGSLLAGVTLIFVGLPVLRQAPRRRAVTDLVAGLGIWVVGALPWLVASAVGGSAAVSGSAVSGTGLAGARAFGLRAEPGLGSIGTAFGLGGIWNSDAAPASRTVWWASVATVCLLILVVVGSAYLWRRRAALDVVVGATAVLAIVVVVAVAIAATGPGTHALGWLADTVPGAGLLRDTQKFLAPAVVFMSLATAGACASIRHWLPAGFAFAATVLLIVAPLPDLAWGVGGHLDTTRYPADFARVGQIVTAHDGAVLLWPPGSLRRYDFADGTSLDPTPRMLRAPVLQSGELVVDGVTVDDADPGVAAAQHLLSSGGSAAELAELGVGWVLAEGASPPPPPPGSSIAFAGKDLRLYRIPGAETTETGSQRATASNRARMTAWTANVVWLTVIVVGLVAGPVRAGRRARRSRRR